MSISAADARSALKKRIDGIRDEKAGLKRQRDAINKKLATLDREEKHWRAALAPIAKHRKARPKKAKRNNRRWGSVSAVLEKIVSEVGPARFDDILAEVKKKIADATRRNVYNNLTYGAKTGKYKRVKDKWSVVS